MTMTIIRPAPGVTPPSVSVKSDHLEYVGSGRLLIRAPRKITLNVGDTLSVFVPGTLHAHGPVRAVLEPIPVHARQSAHRSLTLANFGEAVLHAQSEEQIGGFELLVRNDNPIMPDRFVLDMLERNESLDSLSMRLLAWRVDGQITVYERDPIALLSVSTFVFPEIQL